MSLEKTFTPKAGIEIPEGPQVGLFLNLIHIGVQKVEYKGVTSYKDQILVTYELPDVIYEGRPLTLSTRMSTSFSPKSTLYKHIKALNGGKSVDHGVDYEVLLGKPVQLEIGKTSGGNSKISGVSTILSSVAKTVPKLVNTPTLFLDVDNISDKELKQLPEWIQKVINERSSNDQAGSPNDIEF